MEFEFSIVYQPPLSEEAMGISKAMIKALDEKDEHKKAQETALNNLETFVIDMRDKLYQEIYEKSSTEEERTKITEKLSEIGDWIDEEAGPFTEISILEEKLTELKTLTSALFARVREHTDRPEALGALNNMINSSNHFLTRARNNSGEDGLFTETELDTLQKKLDTIEQWKIDAEKEQEAQPMSEMPKMTTSLIAEKGLELDREVKYLINKAKIAKADKEREKRKKEAEAKAEAEKEKKAKKKKKSKSNNETEDATSEDKPAEETTSDESTPVENEDSVTPPPVNEEESTPLKEEEESVGNEEETVVGGEEESKVKDEDESASSENHTEL